MNATTDRRPAREFQVGPLFAAVWMKTRKTTQGETVVHTVRIQKRYRDDCSGQWKSTSYLRPEDLPKLALLATRVYEDIYFRASGPSSAS